MNNSGEVRNLNNEEKISDSFSSLKLSQRVRIDKKFRREQLMELNQLTTWKNHGGKAVIYDDILIFSLRPPELLDVLKNPVDYFLYCFIGRKSEKYETIEEMLNDEIYKCCWIDFLGRQIKIKIMALDEIKTLLQNNLSNLGEDFNFSADMNNMVLYTIDL